MVNETDFQIIKPTVAALNFALKPKPFIGQFTTQAKQILPDLNHPLSIVAALDCGYGLVAGDRVLATHAEWNDLLTYASRRLNLIGSLLEKAPPGPGPGIVSRASFARFLETNEQNPAAYALGMIYTRFVTEQWHLLSGAPGGPKKFWHYKIPASPAANLSGVGIVWPGDNPDFFVQDAFGRWSAVESKGSLKGFRAGELKKGVKQAYKFATFSISTPPAAPAISQVFCDRTCSLAYFDKTNALQVMHLARPQVSTAIAPSVINQVSDPIDAPLVWLEAADLLRFEEALMQFISHAGTEELEATSDLAIRWYPSKHLPDSRLGLLGVHLRLAAPLRWAVKALNAVVPQIAIARSRGTSGAELGSTLRVLESTLTTPPESLSESPSEQEATRTLADLLGRVELAKEDLSWLDLLRLVWSEPLLASFDSHYTTDTHSIGGMWAALNDRIFGLIHALRRRQFLDAGLDNGTGEQFAVTTHGLFVEKVDEPNEWGDGQRGSGVGNLSPDRRF